jgi:hypothetical protein
MLKQQPVGENVTTSNFAQQDTVSSVVKEVGQFPGEISLAVKKKTQDEMRNEIATPKNKPTKQPKNQPKNRPNKQPKNQPNKQPTT